MYVDDTLAISENAENIIRNEIGKYFEMKEASIGKPDIYLGGKVNEVVLNNGAKTWSFSSSQYVQAAVNNVGDYLEKRGEKLQPRVKAPFTYDYRPEIDTSPELDAIDAAYYASLIGILRWTVELGRIDIAVEVSIMSSYMAMPREGHLKQLYHMFSYLKSHHNAEMVFDPSDPDIDMNDFEEKDWSGTVYATASKEELPPNMPEPRGQSMKMVCYVDSDHVGDSVTRRLRTGFLVFLQSSPILLVVKETDKH